MEKKVFETDPCKILYIFDIIKFYDAAVKYFTAVSALEFSSEVLLLYL